MSTRGHFPIRLALALWLTLGSTYADEVIEEFASEIRVQADGSMLVTERIRVRAEGRRIRRGIYRDFPTDYRDARGNAYRVAFTVLGVTRDGTAEPHHTQRRGNGVRLYIGHEDVFISPGVYEYAITYRTNRQLGFFTEHDELYWNVTGTGWDFRIERAGASVMLPDGVPGDTIRVEGYTGPQGARGQNYQASVDSNSIARFVTTQALAPREGLTIVVAWPKGFVTEPGAGQRLIYVFRDNLNLLVGVSGVAAILVYYLMMWHTVGRDPEAGVVIPHYQPPVGYSPASTRFIRRMGYDHKAFAAAVVNLAVKQALTISEEDGEFTLTPNGIDGVELAPGEAALYRQLFTDKHSLTLRTANHSRIAAAVRAHKRSLARDYEKRYFAVNRGWLVPGMLVSIATLIGYLTLAPSPETQMPGMIITAMLLIVGWRAFQAARGDSGWRRIFRLLPLLVFLAVALHLGRQLISEFPLTELPIGGVVLAAVLVLLNIAFYQLLKAPTLAGRRLLDRLAGFREYLQVAEQDELNLKHPPRMTPELFEAYLPFALALDVEQQWSERFAREFDNLHDKDHYQPVWYRGRRWNSRGLSGMSRSLGNSLSSAIASSSVAPGSSSGGGGGGSSGGGGGGGGGGGW